MSTNNQTNLLPPITSHNYTLPEIARYQPETITPDELVDLLTELQAWRDTGYCNHRLASNFDTPEELVDVLEALEEETATKDGELETLYEERDKLQEELDDALQELRELKESIENEGN